MLPLRLLIPLSLPLIILSLQLPIWVILVGGIFLIWSFLSIVLNFQKPSKKIAGGISVACLIGVYSAFDSLIGREPAGAFLFLLTGLKILEFEKEEESLMLIILGVFLICTSFLFSLDIVLSLLLFFSLLGLIFQLTPEKIRTKSQARAIKIFLKTVLSALPLTLFLFFFFPRLTDDLWKIASPHVSGNTQSGFGESLNPGTISEIVKSSKLVFRAEFLIGSNRSSDLYWRGETLEHPLGFSWKKGGLFEEVPLPPQMNHFPDYRVLLEPQNQRWLFALEGTGSLQSDDAQLTRQKTGIFRTALSLEKAITYNGTMDFTRLEESNPEKYLTLPNRFPERIKALVQSWKIGGFTPEKKLEQILSFFRDGNYHYTLQPVEGGHLTLERFLFVTKKGFCEHFASSLALLLRASGVPSRVVVGFQGGTFNDIGNFWIIREKDAHAWVEYVNSRGRWTRADATSEVAPLRLEIGAEDYFGLPTEIQTLRDFKNSKDKWLRTRSWSESISIWVRGINYRWTTWLTNFDMNKQKEMLDRLPVSPRMFTLIAVFLCLWAALFIHRLRKKVLKPAPEDQMLWQILAWPEFRNINPHKTLGPRETLAQIQALGSESRTAQLYGQLKQFFDLYEEVAYGSRQNQLDNLSSCFRDLTEKYRKLQTKLNLRADP